MIIRFLSGEMDPEEKRQFEASRDKDPELREAFEKISGIWDLARESLNIDGKPLHTGRDELVAWVIATLDREEYAVSDDPARERAFRKKMEKIMEQPPEKNRIIRHPGVTRFLLAAAAVALLLVLFMPQRSMEQLAAGYYDPAGDPLFCSYDSRTAAQEQGVMLVKDGLYAQARALFEADPGTPDLQTASGIAYAISCYETGDSALALSILTELATGKRTMLAMHAGWYISLYLLESGRSEEAIPYLVAIAADEGAFSRKAAKILRKSNIKDSQ